MDAVRSFRIWAGSPSYRGMAAGSSARVAHSTLYAALHRDDVPALSVLVAVVTGCGGDSADVDRFVSAWRRLALPPGSQAPLRLSVAS
jgi:hypothetical protein